MCRSKENGLKITGVRTVVYEYPLRRLTGDAHFPTGSSRQANLAVFLDTDEDLVGVSICHPPGAEPHIRSLVNGLLLDRDPYQVRGLFEEMVRSAIEGDNHGYVAWAIGAIDTALWDLRAKRNGVPLWKELGATTSRVRAYASGLDMPLSDEQLSAYYREMAAMGVTAGKLKVGRDPDADLRRLGIVRDALTVDGLSPSLMVDANEFWSPHQAIRRVAEMEEQFDLLWVEEPAPRWDYAGLRRVKTAIRSAVASGENLADISEFVPLITGEAADIIQVGAYSGGISGCLGIADLAAVFGLQVSMMNCPGRFLAHAAAAMPNHLMMEVTHSGRDVAFASENRLEDGWITLGDAPGIGIDFDPDLLASYTVDAPTSSTTWAQRGRDPMAGRNEPPRRLRPN